MSMWTNIQEPSFYLKTVFFPRSIVLWRPLYWDVTIMTSKFQHKICTEIRRSDIIRDVPEKWMKRCDKEWNKVCWDGGWGSGGVKGNFFTFLLSLDHKNRWNTATRLQNKVIVKDGLCNHLNEKEESQNKDTYDHACPVTISGHAIGLDDSSTWDHHSLNDDYGLSAGTGTDEYSSLEQMLRLMFKRLFWVRAIYLSPYSCDIMTGVHGIFVETLRPNCWRQQV